MSTTVKKEQKNGVTKTPTVKAAIQKPATDQPKEQPKLSLEQRIQKVEELRSLTGKRQRTVETLNNLRTFQYGSDENSTLIITDSQGMKFATSNSNLIGMLSEYFVHLLGDKVSALDDEILGFQL